MQITNDILYVGVNDHETDLFEGQYAVPNGMAYNSYVIKDEKVAVVDTVDAKFTHEWLDNVREALGGEKPEYLIVQHMEPDHSANIQNFMKVYPDTKIVANEKTFTMIQNFFRSMDFGDKKVEVKNGDTLSLGKHELTFVFAPMVHWPEVMVTYDSTDKVLFSAERIRKIRSTGCGGRMGLRGTPLLYRNCRQIRRTSTESLKNSISFGYSDHLPSARPCFERKPRTLY